MPNDVTDAELISSLRDQVRVLTAERDAFTASLEREAQVADALRARVAELEAFNERLRGTVRTREAAELEALAEADEFRARVAEVEADLTATQAKFNGAAGACLALGTRATKAERERDAALEQAATSRAAALEEAVGVIRQGLSELAKMPTPTKGHESLATLQRNLLEKCVSEIEALATTPPPPVVPVAKVVKGLRRLAPLVEYDVLIDACDAIGIDYESVAGEG